MGVHRKALPITDDDPVVQALEGTRVVAVAAGNLHSIVATDEGEVRVQVIE